MVIRLLDIFRDLASCRGRKDCKAVEALRGVDIVDSETRDVCGRVFLNGFGWLEEVGRKEARDCRGGRFNHCALGITNYVLRKI